MRGGWAGGMQPRPGRGTLSAAVALVVVAVLAACSGIPRIQLDTGTPGPPTGQPSSAEVPTVTVTTTVTATAAATDPPNPNTTVSSTTGPPAGPTSLPTAPTIPSTFDDAAARAAITRLISGIGQLDHELAQPTGDPAGLTAVDDDLAALLAAGVPAGTDGPSYVARILSLRVFVSAVRSEVGTDRTQAVARYAVVRRETAVLLGQLNVALGASYLLPPPPSPSATTSTAPAQ